MMLIEDVDEFYEKGTVGDWTFKMTEETTPRLLIQFRYPISDQAWAEWHPVASDVNRGDICSVPITQGAATNYAWQWDGNRQAPTLSPSIAVHAPDGRMRWHGFLREGKVITLEP